jgi:hypothetical protein
MTGPRIPVPITLDRRAAFVFNVLTSSFGSYGT